MKIQETNILTRCRRHHNFVSIQGIEVADLIDKGGDGGFVIRNDQGNPLPTGVLNLRSNTINVSEALALREAITWARRKKFSCIIVEGASKLIIDVVQGKCEIPWNLRSILEDIKLWITFIFGMLVSLWKHLMLFCLMLLELVVLEVLPFN
ncbi:hypothetical protein DVH24_010794 [Malus domestica]|uniref:RNase H type-1 domain-containing protein n=1 Tax=Malus domestica TaxID=3750 RepID=A0A498JRA2_MALDO|nr:hypothetical protein DVH24_010794 [Malus domestica]